MLKNFNRCKLIVDNISASYNRRFSQSSIDFKRYKYAINKTNQRPTVSLKGGPRKQRPFVYGDKTLTFFSLDENSSNNNGDDTTTSTQLFNPKQKVYSELVREAVQDLLVSNDIVNELKNLNLNIVDVEVSSSLSSAYVVWSLPKSNDNVDDELTVLTKDEVTSLLNQNLTSIRSLLPAYTSLTNIPTIHFVYDIFSERQQQIEELLDTVKKEVEEFEQRDTTSH